MEFKQVTLLTSNLSLIIIILFKIARETHILFLSTYQALTSHTYTLTKLFINISHRVNKKRRCIYSAFDI